MRSRIAAAFICSLLFAGGCSSGNDESSTAEDSAIDASELVQLLAPLEFEKFMATNADAPVVNVHIPYEGHIDDTDSFVPFDTISEWDALPADKSQPIVLYCRSGNMSGEAAQVLADLGYTNIVDLDGGMKAWESAGLKLQTTEPAESVEGT